MHRSDPEGTRGVEVTLRRPVRQYHRVGLPIPNEDVSCAISFALPHTLAVATIAVATIASAQGRCIRAYGTPACNADAIKPVFEKTGWRTTSINQITFRVAEPEKEAAFYVALMGWKLRSEDAKRVVMDVGDWGTVIFRRVPVDSFLRRLPVAVVAAVVVVVHLARL